MVRDSLREIVKTSKFLKYRFNYLINYILIGFFSVLLEVMIVKYLGGIGTGFYFSVIIGFATGVMISFILNAKINFRVPKSQNTQTFFIFVVISTIALCLNIFLMKTLIQIISFNYGTLRFITAGCVFMVSYLAHRRITFKFVKKVGIAVYLSKNQSITQVYSKIKNYIDFIHLDLVDSTFSKEKREVNLSIIKEVDKTWMLEKMLHIMSKKPSKWINRVQNHVSTIIIHTDIDEDVHSVINLCRKYGKKVGLAIRTGSPIEEIMPYLKHIDFVQVMGIRELGKSGQLFDPSSLKKVADLNKLKEKFSFEIIFDGGVKTTNIGRINAKYIVSSSGLLSPDNPVEAFMELKTSSRYKDIPGELRKSIINSFRKSVNSLEFIDSGTIVGSFSETMSLVGASDIDMVIIVDKLDKKKFNLIVEKFEKEKAKIESDYGYEVYINTSFGPLKFDKKKIVFHLMIYDRKSHMLHCQKSPFTCFDWQRSNLYFKKPMAEICPVNLLEPNFFFSARRSAEEYLTEIKKNVVSYRMYKSEGNRIIEEKKEKKMDDKARIEFAYHIPKFLMINFLKIYEGVNRTYGLEDRISKYFEIFPLNRKKHSKFIRDISKLKMAGKYSPMPSLIHDLEAFILDFEKQLRRYFYENSTQIQFIRHGKTKMNKPGIFIGQRVNPDILPIKKTMGDAIKTKLENANIIFSSPLKRCENTVKMFFDKKIIFDDRLKEIDYGLADGKDVDYLSKKYPEMQEDWELGDDPRFPQGENFRDVALRLKSFLKDVKKLEQAKILVCTHNCVIRALLGMGFRIPLNQWYKLYVPHLEQIKVIITPDKKIRMDLSPEQIKEILKNF